MSFSCTSIHPILSIFMPHTVTAFRLYASYVMFNYAMHVFLELSSF